MGQVKEVAVRQIESVLVMTQAQITYEAMVLLSQHGIPVIYIEQSHPISAVLPFANHGFIATRRAQFAAYNNRLGIEISTQMLKAAAINKSRLLRYYARNRRRTDSNQADQLSHAADNIDFLIPQFAMALTGTNTSPQTLTTTSIGGSTHPISDLGNISPVENDPNADISALLYGSSGQPESSLEPTISNVRQTLMGIEGTISNIYFTALTDVFQAHWNFDGRNRRPPKDPMNAALSFGYHLLGNEVLIALSAAGLEPYAGFIHSDRSGRPSLVYDLIEEFRQPVVDRLVIKLFNRNSFQPNDFEQHGSEGGIRFNEQSLGKFLTEFYAYLRKEGQSVGNSLQTYQKLIFRQARRVVRVLLEKEPEYEGFTLDF